MTMGTARRRWARWAVYPWRTIAVGAAGWWWLANHWVGATSAAGETWERLLGLTAQLDVWHALFWSLIPVGLMLWLAPARRSAARSGIGPMAATAVVAATAFALPLVAPWWHRVQPPVSPLFVGTCAWLAVNAGGLWWWHRHQRGGERGARWLTRAVGVADALVPLWVWAVYRREVGRRMAWWRPLPVALVLAGPMVAWLVTPLPADVPIREAPGLRRIAGGNLWDAMVDPTDGEVVITQETPRLIARLDPSAEPPRWLARRSLPREAGNIRALDADWARRKLVSVNLPVGRTYVLNADTLEIERAVEIADAPPVHFDSPCGTRWFGRTGGLFAYCPEGLFRLCADGRTMRATADYAAVALVPDEKRREVIPIGTMAQLSFLRENPLRLERFTGKPYRAQDGVIDRVNDRLVVTLPVDGELMVTDLKTMWWRRVPVWPGAGALDLDTRRRLMVTGGTASAIDIRRADDLRSIARRSGPPHVRSVAVDETRGLAYLASATHGLWQLDLKTIRAEGWASWVARADPFYFLVDLAADAARRGLGWSDRVQTSRPTETVRYRAEATCGSETWFGDPAGALEDAAGEN